MPVHYRAQVTWQVDSGLPRDGVSINPCIRDQGALSNPQGLADDLADALPLWVAANATAALTVKLYDLEGTPPVFPAATAVRNPTNFAPTSFPRELAVCLSFYSEQNVPRRRGRLYLPYFVLATSGPGLRPTSTVRDKAGALAPVLAALGGIDVDWIVWSTVERAAHKVDHWWVDDEWDTVRSRGLRSTTRSSGTTGG